MKNKTELSESLKILDKKYHEALKTFREIEQERNELKNLISLPEYKKNIGRCYRKPNAGSDSDDELAHYQYIKITDAVYEPNGWFYPEPRYVGFMFGIGLKGAIHFYSNDYISIDDKCEEIDKEKFNKEYTRLVNKLMKNECYNKKS